MYMIVINKMSNQAALSALNINTVSQTLYFRNTVSSSVHLFLWMCVESLITVTGVSFFKYCPDGSAHPH